MNVQLTIKRIIADPSHGQFFIITAPHKVNEKGAFRIPAAQLENMATQAGMTVQQLMAYCQGGTFSFDAQFVKKDEEWTGIDRTSGEQISGKYTVDHWRSSNQSIEIAPEKRFMLDAAIAFSNKLNVNDFFRKPASVVDIEEKETEPQPDPEVHQEVPQL